MATTFYCSKNLAGAGSRVIVNFMELFQNKFAEKVKKYISNKINDGEFEHLFYYGEQQTKTYVTATLDQITKTNFMQETQVERKKHKPNKKKEFLRKGRIDYLCRFGENTKISVLMEVKQAWIQYFSPKKWKIPPGVSRRHSEVITQLRNIHDKMGFAIDNLYGLALTVVPLYTRYESEEEKQVAVRKRIIEKIIEDAVKKTKANAYGYMIIPQRYCKIDSWYDDKCSKKIYESHPGIIFLWTVRKYTKK